MHACAQSHSTDMSVVTTGLPSRVGHTLTVGDIVAHLNAKWPATHAEVWDKTGLLVGDPNQEVTKVCVALDVTLDAIKKAADEGAQMLLTHHPAFLKLNRVVSDPLQDVAGAMVYEAVSRGVALVNYHTALDMAPEAFTMLSSMLHAEFEQVLLPTQDIKGGITLGYGQVASFSPDDAQTLSTLAARCMSVFGATPRVWASTVCDDSILRIATWTGSLDESAVNACLNLRIPVLICGEIKYHTALDAQQKGLSIIELGHDVSENPYVVVLAQALCNCGVPTDAISIISRDPHWYNPETRRV